MHMMKRPARSSTNYLLCLVLAATLALTVTRAFALSGEPHLLVSDVIARVMERIGALDAETLEMDDAVSTVFEQELSPHLDFLTITRWLSGKRWEQFSEAQRAELTGVIREHIVQVYSSLLARGQSVEIDVAQSSTINKRSARVEADLSTPDGRNFDVEFRLLQGPEAWLLYDLVVDGVSFARSMRAEIGPIIAADGVPGVRRYLYEHGR